MERPPIYSMSIRSTDDNLDVCLVSELVAEGQSCGAKPLPCGIWWLTPGR